MRIEPSIIWWIIHGEIKTNRVPFLSLVLSWNLIFPKCRTAATILKISIFLLLSIPTEFIAFSKCWKSFTSSISRSVNDPPLKYWKGGIHAFYISNSFTSNDKLNWQKIKQLLSNTLRMNLCYLRIIHILDLRYFTQIIGHILKKAK